MACAHETKEAPLAGRLKSKRFFFEKKKQKTFVRLAAAFPDRRA
jgi:hypothetical protein